MKYEPLQSIHHGIMTRCYNKNSKDYKYYGGRGIKVCDRWSGSDGLKHFREDMGPRPEGKTKKGAPLYSLDRIDRNGPYSPENCKWSTWEEQMNNRGIATALTFNGKTHTITEWAEITGIGREALYRRVNLLGWDAKKALTTPQKKGKRGKKIFLEYRGGKVSLLELAKIIGVSKASVYQRYQMGWSAEEIVAEPKAEWGKLKNRSNR